MSIKNRVAMLIGSLALATTALVGPGVVPAAAAGAPGIRPDLSTATEVTSVAQATADGWAQLYIYDFENGNYWITVWGRASVPPTSLAIKLYGDDTFFDQLIWTQWPHHTNADGTFYIEFPLNSAGPLMNEDWGQDEIYARVFFHYGSGSSKSVLTPNFNGYF